MSLILDGNHAASAIKHKVREAIAESGTQPQLAIVLVGHDPASKIYVRNKAKDCEQCGIDSVTYVLPEDTSEEKLVELIRSLSNDDSVHGILVQLPLPKHINKDHVISAIKPEKDVDGFTKANTMAMLDGKFRFVPCTPGGIIELMRFYKIPIVGRHCVIVGRSDIVGKPMATIALWNNATTTICHSHTRNLGGICKSADILISATGRKNLIKPEFIKPNTTIIDVGMNRDKDGKLCGDCNPEAYERSSAYTPVPGGVGPMTRAMLLLNAVTAAGLKVRLDW